MSSKKRSLQYLFPISSLVFYKTFRKWFQFIKTSETWTEQQIKNYQLQQLNEILNHAKKFVPYYTTKFKKKNNVSSKLNSLSDLQHLPMLRKNHIREHIEELKATNYPTIAFKETRTGGATGKPLMFYIEKARWLSKHFAFNKVYMQQAGYKSTDKIISITGKKKPIQYHPFLLTLEFSSIQMNQQNLSQYATKTFSFQPQFITSYPSALYIFTNYLTGKNKPLPKIKAIFTHGETLFDWQQRLFEQRYNCPVYDQYGHREQCVFATSCSKSNLYHIFPQYGIVELINEKGKTITSPGQIGEIVATSLHSKIFPFIRYKTGDLAELSSKKCSCERNYPLLKKIIGRKQDFLFTKNNDIIPLTGLYHLIAESSKEIRECQLVQEREGDLIIRLVKDKAWTRNEQKTFEEHLQNQIGDIFNITFDFVDHIPRTTNGKYRYLIQKIPYNIKS